MLGQHSHHVSEALIYGDVQRSAQRVVQEVDVGAFAQQEPRNLRLITEQMNEERVREEDTCKNYFKTVLILKIYLSERLLSIINILFGCFLSV